MNTQKQIFEKLAKQQLDKQNLGAIEDAVSDLENRASNLNNLLTNLIDVVDNTLIARDELMFNLEDAIGNIDLNEVSSLVSELDSAENFGLKIDSDVIRNIKSIEDTIQQANQIRDYIAKI